MLKSCTTVWGLGSRVKDLLFGTFGDPPPGEGFGVCPRHVSWAGESNGRIAFTKVHDIPELPIPLLISS